MNGGKGSGPGRAALANNLGQKNYGQESNSRFALEPCGFSAAKIMIGKDGCAQEKELA
jgi:hypothetical protein